MPKARRDRVVHLTQTKKKGRDLKTKLVEQVREAVDTYEYVYVFDVENMRNSSMKEVRAELQGSSRFFMGKTKVLQIALGRTPEDECAENIHQLAQQLQGSAGLLFSRLTPQEVTTLFAGKSEPNYARSGFVATYDFAVPAGPLAEFGVSMEPVFRQLGLDVRLQNGVIMLLKDTKVCSEGEVLSPEQCKLLEYFGQQMAVFRVSLRCYWTDGRFAEIEMPDAAPGAGDVEMADA